MKRSAVEHYENFYGHFSVQICARYTSQSMVALIFSLWAISRVVVQGSKLTTNWSHI